MKKDDVELIQRILSNDEAAFAELVDRYRKQVHALAWRKTDDFHIAQDITQEVFIKVFQDLHTLRDPKLFPGWLYVTTANCCNTWHRKKRIPTEPLEDEETMMSEEDLYSQHVVEERTKTIVESQREVVRKLLAKLKESERTVMTLHYLGEMTVGEISKFIGVSPGTIKSRLQRARNRLQKEETMIREALEHFQISPNLTDNIIKESARLKPVTPSATKPLIPWVVAASGAILIVIMLGISSQFSARFHQPFNLDAQTETLVELIDVPLLPNLDAEPDVRQQLGNLDATGTANSSQQNPDDVSSAAAQDDDDDDFLPKQQWIEYEPQSFVYPRNLLTTTEGDLYALSGGGHLYKLENDNESWEHIIDMSSLEENFMDGDTFMAKLNGIIYIVRHHEFYASKDDGKTWDLIYEWEIPIGDNSRSWEPEELVLTEKAFYVVFSKATFRSEDQGKTWKDMREEFKDMREELKERPSSFIVIQNTVFATAGIGLYRKDNDRWKRLELPIPETVNFSSVAGSKNRLYALAILEEPFDYQAASEGRQRTWWVFRSTDLGNTWKDITPTNAWPIKGMPPYATLIAAGDNILIMEKGMVSSTDAGDTWLPPLKPNVAPSMDNYDSPAAVLNDIVIYVSSGEGFKRSSDGGQSWDSIEIPVRRKFSRNIIDNLIVYKGSDKSQKVQPAVYVKSWRSIEKTTNNGKSWTPVKLDVPMTAPYREEQPSILRIVASDDQLYVKGERYASESINLYQVSDGGNTLKPIPGVPTLDSGSIMNKVNRGRKNSSALSDKQFIEDLKEDSVGADQFFKELIDLAKAGVNSPLFQLQPAQYQHDLIERGLNGAIAVSGDTFYLEYNFKLLRWTQGEGEWYDTGVEETIGLTLKAPNGTYLPPGMWHLGVPKGTPQEALGFFRAIHSLKLAVSGDTVYVGKREGLLLVSYDRGESWTNITSRLPLPVILIKDIKIKGHKVYVATDAGVLMSSNGTHWQTITDAAGEHLVMEHLAVDGNWLCGITDNTGVYLLVNDTWEQIVSETPEKYTSLAIDGNTLYVGTQKRGMLHYVLDQ